MRGFLIFISCIIIWGVSSSVEAKQVYSKKHKVEMLNWTDVNEILPKYTKFKVRDLETGKEFRVQRRAGSQHADVQPLTSKDTKIMKEIYNGKWSWKRRAIIVIYRKKKIAASMHGMPHGAGALKNNFPGHFCIHFYGSTTHRRDFMDLSHKLMVLKAAGKLEEHLQSASPYEVITAYIAGFKERDSLIANTVSLQKEKWKSILPKVENVAIINMTLLPEEDVMDKLMLTIPIEIEWYLKGRGRHTFKGNIHLVRLSPMDAWKIDSDSFLAENQLK